MSYQSVKSVLRSCAPAEGEHPFRAPAGAQRAALEALRTGLGTAGGSEPHVTGWNKAAALVVPIDLPRGHDDSYRFPDSVYVFFSGEEMQVGQALGSDGVPLAGTPHLLRIIEGVQERLREARGRERKRDKVRGLKARFIQTQVEALAKRLGVACDVTARPSRVEAFVHLGSHNGIELHIPYGRAEEVLAGLPPVIEAARTLYQRGARAGATFSIAVRSYGRDAKPR